MLEFAKIDAAAFERVVGHLAQRGISVHSLSSLSADSDYEGRAAALLGIVYTAAHGVNKVKDDLALENWFWELRQYQADGVMIAVQDAQYVGFGALLENQMMTGPTGIFYGALKSHADFRLEIALAIVAAQVRYLQANGFECLHFEVDSDDPHGMALIAALPVTPQPAFVTYLRPLEPIRAG